MVFPLQITAYTQCEGYLDWLQANRDPDYRMVVSMSLGAPGPLSLEKLYFRCVRMQARMQEGA